MLCPCSSGDQYQDCCQPFHEGRLPETALQLMRSRYSAYSLDLPDYIIETTHPQNPHYHSKSEDIRQFSKVTTFQKLEIHDATKTTVIFTAHLFQGGRDATFTEKSTFEKVDGRWLYLSGEFLPNP